MNLHKFLNLRYANKEDFNNLDNFLQWFMTSIALELDLVQQVEEYWAKSHHNSKIKCRKCFERYVLPGDKPLAIALDEVDRLFPYQEIAAAVPTLLRVEGRDCRDTLNQPHCCRG
ncbi:AAA-like domain-containing protein [Nostoc sp. CHAB 5836]|uniref:AAA-like domain-containing protein n=1 Tax=Nostoc sp. CHAB 5836 TaxID=2780404 RepID=UPI001E57B46D|nr:AAA-like domain-containing protein [Nostoc sp. CHAB 5836]MCC5614098.1 AAA-like domain-containing protein [Nostoc sp. CHAB 5836]